MRKLSRLILGVAMLSLPLPALAQVNPVWTAVANTGVIDEANLTPVNFAFTGSALGHLGASIAPPVVARYNVVNLGGNQNPAWTTLQLGAIDTSAAVGNDVTASLIRVNPCTGARVIICTAVSITNSTGACTVCNFAAGTFNFNAFLYEVEVTVSRTASTVTEQATTLRIF